MADLLEADASSVARTQGCVAREVAIRFRSHVIGSIGRIPPRYQEPLTSAVNDLVDRIPPCPQPTDNENQNGDERGHGHGRHDKHKHKKGHD